MFFGGKLVNLNGAYDKTMLLLCLLQAKFGKDVESFWFVAAYGG